MPAHDDDPIHYLDTWILLKQETDKDLQCHSFGGAASLQKEGSGVTAHVSAK